MGTNLNVDDREKQKARQKRYGMIKRNQMNEAKENKYGRKTED